MSLSGSVSAEVDLSAALSFLEGSVSAEVDVSGALSFLEGTIAVPVSVSGSLGYTAMVAATDTSGCNLELDVSGSLTVAPLVVPPPAIFGS